MKAIMVMYDSLNRRMLPPYGCDWVHAPNFARLADRCVTFDRAYVGSMPCMPARREIQTGRYNFLHRSWGPMEPFDDSMPAILTANGVYTHLVTDHYHYWEEGGATYHTKYRSYQLSRGQEGDAWIGEVQDPEILETVGNRDVATNNSWRQDWVNRTHMSAVEQQPQHKTFTMGMEFIRANAGEDNWFLQIETFDPHEPYFTHRKYKDLYPHDYDGPHFDWPDYGKVKETREQVQHMRYESAALHSMCDEYLGKVLDVMDELDLWGDTMLIVNTDHGFLLGEHDWWGKCVQPFYEEVSHMPLFVCDPRSGVRGQRRTGLVQTIDLAPTLLEYFGIEPTPDMQGRPLCEAVASDAPVREAGLFGNHGGHVNVTDGRYVYMRAPTCDDNRPLYNYTLMPTHMRSRFSVEELQDVELADPWPFTKGCRTLRIPGRTWRNPHEFGTLLFDLEADPHQERPIDDPAVAARMTEHLVRLMRASDAPAEQYERLGLQEALAATDAAAAVQRTPNT